MTINKQRLLDDLTDLVAVPSVSADPARSNDVRRSANVVAAAFQDAGVDAAVVVADGGHPAVVGRLAGPTEAPTVLLYAHYDVQPVGDMSAWQSDPFVVTERDGRLFGRGTADDKGGIAVHVETLRVMREQLPVSVAIFIEGEEEVGSPTLHTLLSKHADLLRADVVLAPDSVNVSPLAPSLTMSLRGILNVLVTVRTADRAVHSGLYGGAVPDALSALARTLGSLTDEDGVVAIDGLNPGIGGAADGPAVETIRTGSGLLPGVRLLGRGPLGVRLWHSPAVNVTGIDAPAATGAANALTPTASATVSVRLAPEDDPAEAFHAIETHVRTHTPWGAEVNVRLLAAGRGWRADVTSPGVAVASEVLGEAFGTPVTYVGVGGSIPFVAALAEAMPSADILVTAVQDPQTQAHAANESVAPAALFAATAAQVELLRRLAQRC